MYVLVDSVFLTYGPISPLPPPPQPHLRPLEILLPLPLLPPPTNLPAELSANDDLLLGDDALVGLLGSGTTGAGGGDGEEVGGAGGAGGGGFAGLKRDWQEGGGLCVCLCDVCVFFVFGR